MRKRKSKSPTLSRTERTRAKAQARIKEIQDLANQQQFKKIDEIMQIYNPASMNNKSYNTYDKETLREYIEAPYQNAANLRALSRFLYNRSQVYRKIININACMIDTHYRQVIPNVDFTKRSNSSGKIDKSFHETGKMLDLMNLPLEMLKVYLECWTVDVFYGVYYYFKDVGGVMFPLDPDWCQITGVYPTGDFAYAIDCSQLRAYESVLDELWGEPFVSLYKEYQRDTQNNRWLQMPDEYACCMKVNVNDFQYALPPYLPLFNPLINLSDLEEAQALQQEAQIYKLLSFKLPLVPNSNRVDDFAIDPKTAVKYYDKATTMFPDYIGAWITPMDVEPISFPDDAASDVNKVDESSKNIMKSAGHASIAEPKGTTAYEAALKADEDYAISALLPQTEGWVNRMLQNYLSNPSRVKFLEVTKYTKKEFKDSILKDMNFGLPMITVLGALNGFSEMELFALAEGHEMMELRSKFYPYQTSATLSANNPNNPNAPAEDGGRPQNETPTDESEASADKKEEAG